VRLVRLVEDELRVVELCAEGLEVLRFEPRAVELGLGLGKLGAQLGGLCAGAVEPLLCDDKLILMLLDLCAGLIELAAESVDGTELLAQPRDLSLVLGNLGAELVELRALRSLRVGELGGEVGLRLGELRGELFVGGALLGKLGLER
jgi:hypothetical protein